MKEFFDSELFDGIRKFFDLVSEKFRNIREPSRPFIIKSFIAIFLLISSLSVAVVILEVTQKNPNLTTTVTDAQNVSQTQVEETAPESSGLNANILFGLDNEEGDAHLLFLMSVDSESQQMKIFFLDPEAVCKVNEIEGSLLYHLKNGGVSQLVLAASAYTGLEIERYLVGDEKAFTSFIKYLGDVEIDVKESISYTHNGLSYIIDDGVQIMTADMLLKYIVYLSADTEKYGDNLRDIFAMFAKLMFDFESSQQAQDNFGKVIGFFETNISALDFSENKLSVMKLAHEISLKLEAYNTLAEFKGPGEEQ